MKLYVSVALIVSLLYIGCSQNPVSTGNKLIPGSEKFSPHDTSLVSVGDTSFVAVVPNATGAIALVGSYTKNGVTIEAKSLMQLFAILPESLTTVQIDTAQLFLSVNYLWNVDTTAQAGFEIREIQKPWSTTATADSFSQSDFSGRLVGTLSSTVSTTQGLMFQLDTAFIRSWADSLNPSFHSIAIVQKSGSGIWGFSQVGTTLQPYLTVIYEKNGVKDSVTVDFGGGTFVATRTPFTPS